ncbi:MAG TPA: DNA polymerase III subunit delta' [Candidatus Hypogeohydataceae bacterium YC41]
MSFNRILSQTLVVGYFQRTISRERLAHAYLLYGPEGVGKALFARELAKVLFCQKKGTEACDLCNPCRKVDSGTHPDLRWVAPLEGKRDIGIGQIVELETQVYLKPLEAKRKVFVLEDADKMTAAAANCLLKTLEEPPPGTLFLLTTASIHSLYSTIVSRCQKVRFHPLPTNVVKRLLSERLDWQRYKGLAALSCGSLGRATKLMEEKVITHIDRFLEIIQESRLEDCFSISEELMEWCPETKGLESRRSLLRTWLDLLLAYYRDMLLYKAGSSECTSGELELFYEALVPSFKARTRELSVDTLLQILEEIIAATEGLYNNANLNLLLDNLFLRIVDYEKGGVLHV